MFLARRPSPTAIERFLSASASLPLSYEPVGLVRDAVAGARPAETTTVIGRGAADFARARAALTAWQQFDIGWVELFPRPGSIAVGTVVAVLIRHLGCWSLNGCRVVYHLESSHDTRRFGVAYGTLTNHAESGEELFEVIVDPRTDEVVYRIRAASRPQVVLSGFGRPIVRVLQARFRHHSAAAMKRAIGAPAGRS